MPFRTTKGRQARCTDQPLTALLPPAAGKYGKVAQPLCFEFAELELEFVTSIGTGGGAFNALTARRACVHEVMTRACCDPFCAKRCFPKFFSAFFPFNRPVCLPICEELDIVLATTRVEADAAASRFVKGQELVCSLTTTCSWTETADIHF